jgi:signal transduction histidine kinase
VIEEAGLRFTVAMPPGPARRISMLHRELLSQALANLIDNALRHGDSGRGDRIVARKLAGGRSVWTVVDRGPGIAAEDRAQALSRFGRLDRARSLPGAGLGLALVESVARLHGGRFELERQCPRIGAAIMYPAE